MGVFNFFRSNLFDLLLFIICGLFFLFWCKVANQVDFHNVGLSRLPSLVFSRHEDSLCDLLSLDHRQLVTDFIDWGLTVAVEVIVRLFFFLGSHRFV